MSAYDTIAHALADLGMNTKGGSGRTRSQCPVHDSRGLTLSITPGDDRAFLRCFAGCDDTDVLAELGLEVRDLFDGPPPPGYKPPPKREPSPWDVITYGPGIEHVLHRMQVEERLEADPSLRETAREQHRSQVVIP
ncbi:MAG: hypothetical protein WKF79_03315 [Nocardioides sp.]